VPTFPRKSIRERDRNSLTRLAILLLIERWMHDAKPGKRPTMASLSVIQIEGTPECQFSRGRIFTPGMFGISIEN
jgi:hypothetical protein